MPKVDKSQLSKEEWNRLKEFRRREKQKAAIEKEKKKTIADYNKPVPEQTATVFEQEIVQSLPSKENSSDTPKVNNTIAFVLGNGTSRSSIDPHELKSYGKVYGCNALYRTFDPDYLVAVDVKMILELNEAQYQRKNKNVWTNPNKSIQKYRGFNFFEPSKGWSSGPTALWLASQHLHSHIYILGFDYRGLHDGKRFNNMYADTPNYKRSSDSATFFGNWLRQTQTVIKENQHIQYTRVILPDNYQPSDLNNLENLKTITVDEFKKQLKIS